MTLNHIDRELIKILRYSYRFGAMTYVLRNLVSCKYECTTTYIRNRLKRMESAGLVHRVDSFYKNQIKWGLI